MAADDAAPRIHPDALTLAHLLEPTWAETLKMLRASGVLLNEGGDGADAGRDGSDGDDKGTGKAAQPQAGDGGDGGDDLSSLPEPLQRTVKAARKRERDATAQAAALREENETLKNSQLSEQEKKDKKATELATENTTLKTENLRIKVALAKKLPAELVDRLRGTTQKEIEDDADELLKLVKTDGGSTPSFDGGPRQAAPTGGMDERIRRAAGRS